jgi:hypothetical protein
MSSNGLDKNGRARFAVCGHFDRLQQLWVLAGYAGMHGLDTLEDLFKEAGLSPPPKASDICMSEVMYVIDDLLSPI